MMTTTDLNTNTQSNVSPIIDWANQTVNHPAHYNRGKIECIEFIEDQQLGFHRGNALKYIVRAGAKDSAKEIEDLEKARWYLKREIELIQARLQNRPPVRPNDMVTK